jgi:hypothetical protein
VEKAELQLSEGESGENSCTGITNGQSLDIEWYSPKGQLISPSGGRLSSSTIISYEPLTIRSVLRIGQASVAEDNGNFECRIISRDQEKSLRFEARVSEASSSPPPPPRTTTQTRKTTTTVGETEPEDHTFESEHQTDENEIERDEHHLNETFKSSGLLRNRFFCWFKLNNFYLDSIILKNRGIIIVFG